MGVTYDATHPTLVHSRVAWTAERLARFEAERLAPNPEEQQATAIAPVGSDDRSKNPLRPTRFNEIVGQEQAKRMMRRVIAATQERGSALDHVLLVGASGTGKSTFSHVIANELGVDVYEVEAPVSHDTLLELRTTMNPGDMLRIEEIHQQAIMERRGRSAGTEPEVLYAVMEDRTITSGSGILPFPEITIVGTTTDEGMLPDPFINRFPLRPHLEPYSEDDLATIAGLNARQLGVPITEAAGYLFAGASRGVPRQINNYIRNAALLAERTITEEVAREVLEDLNRTTVDGLTADMVKTLVFLYEKGRRVSKTGETTYQASVSTIATAIGKSRDSKAIALRVEPFLIERGYLQVGHGGRRLTDEGVLRARELAEGR